ncbi:MAG: hypothetical protein KIS76_01340 [Pyrinomonadaceae bacterium]|nr:hypothetical protein [Pyrinomonadaceae bacterium]
MISIQQKAIAGEKMSDEKIRQMEDSKPLGNFKEVKCPALEIPDFLFDKRRRPVRRRKSSSII